MATWDQDFSKRLLRVWLEDALRRMDFPQSYREITKQLNAKAATSLHETTVRSWFHGTEPRPHHIAALAEILGADRDYLAFGPRRVLDADMVAEQVEAFRASRPVREPPARPSGPHPRPRPRHGDKAS